MRTSGRRSRSRHRAKHLSRDASNTDGTRTHEDAGQLVCLDAVADLAQSGVTDGAADLEADVSFRERKPRVVRVPVEVRGVAVNV